MGSRLSGTLNHASNGDRIPALDALRAAGACHDVGGERLFVVRQGDAAHEPVLFLHGVPTWSFLWRDVLPVVALEHPTIAVDLLGFGLSDKPPDADFSVEAQATRLLRLLDQLGSERCVIVAHDFGALVAAELLAREPRRASRLIILNTSLRRARWSASSPFSLLRVPILGEMLMSLARPWMLRLAMSIYVARRSRLTREVIAGYWWPFDHGFRRTLLRLARTQWASEERFARWRAALGRLDVPVLIVWGALDPTFDLRDARDLQSLITRSRLEIFDHANHFVPEDRPLALGRLINAFLRDQTKA